MRLRLALPVLLLTTGSLLGTGRFQTQDRISVAIDRGVNEYYEGHFEEAEKILSEADRLLDQVPDRTNDKVNTKFFLGVTRVPLSKLDSTEALFVQVCRLDRDFELSGTEFSPRVTALFRSAKRKCLELECRSKVAEADTLLRNVDRIGALSLLKPLAGSCEPAKVAIATIVRDLFAQAKAAYQKREYSAALKLWSIILEADPGHEVAKEYKELSEERIHISRDELFLKWKASFESRAFEAAHQTYKQLQALGDEADLLEVTDEIEVRYQSKLEALRDAWQAACAKGRTADMKADMKAAYDEAQLVDPDGIMNRATLEGMANCGSAASRQSGTVTSAEPACAVIAADVQRQRLLPNPAKPVYPEIGLRQKVEGVVVLRITINEQGEVARVEVEKGHQLLKDAAVDAVRKWKYRETLINGTPRCVTTLTAIGFKLP